MSANQWHVDEALWQAYGAGRLDEIAEASIDAHVTGCPVCRSTARTAVGSTQTESIWHAVQAEISRPELPWTLRWLRRFGVPEEDLALLAASDGFVLPWAVAVGAALVTTLLSAMLPNRQDEAFLLLAPLVPVFAVVAAFDATEALRDLVRATPYSKLRLILLRTAATLALALPVTIAFGLSIPGLAPLAFPAMLPALALTGSTLVLLTWLDGWPAAGVVALAWAGTVVTIAGFADVDLLTGAPVQLLLAGLTALMCVALVLRTTSYRLLGGEG